MIEKNVAISGRQDAVVYILDDDQSLRTALEDLLELVGLPAKSFASNSGVFVQPTFRHSKLPSA